jgi:hypothetical protein
LPTLIADSDLRSLSLSLSLSVLLGSRLSAFDSRLFPQIFDLD